MESVVINATRRKIIGKQVRALRREGKLPGVIYGRHIQPIMITMDLRQTTRSLAGLAPSALVTVNLDDDKYLTLVREKQRDKILGTLLHVDFLAVSMEEKLRTNVYLDLVGVAPAIKEFNGIIVTGAEVLEVECLPQDLPERITVDLSTLTEIGSAIHVNNLRVSDKVKILDDPDTLIVLVTTPEEEVEAAEAVTAAGEPEVIEKGKKEEEVED
jgi:large subunit ribosomal protein L25